MQLDFQSSHSNGKIYVEMGGDYIEKLTLQHLNKIEVLEHIAHFSC
jgi:hypothetical protein